MGIPMTQTIEDIIPLLRLAVGEKAGGQPWVFDDALQEATIAAWVRLEQGHSRQIAVRGAKQRTVDILRGHRMLGSQDEFGGRANIDSRTVSLTLPGEDGDEFVIEPEDNTFTDHQERTALQDALRPALGLLTERERLVIHRTFWEGLSRQELADELGVSHQAVSKSLKKALEKMRGRLAP